MDLKDTCKMMESADYKERFRAEYAQLSIRYNKLLSTLKGYRRGSLSFSPSCSYELLHEQSIYMKNYLNALDRRAKVESIDVSDLK